MLNIKFKLCIYISSVLFIVAVITCKITNLQKRKRRKGLLGWVVRLMAAAGETMRFWDMRAPWVECLRGLGRLRGASRVTAAL